MNNDYLEYATKKDLSELESVLRKDVSDVDSSIRREIKELERRLRKDLASKDDLKHLGTTLRKEFKIDMAGLEIRLRAEIDHLADKIDANTREILDKMPFIIEQQLGNRFAAVDTQIEDHEVRIKTLETN